MKTSHYFGMISTSLHNRQRDHCLAHKRTQEGNARHKHDILKYNGQVQQYTARYITEERGILPLAMREEILIEN